jgi:hypothetical protein
MGNHDNDPYIASDFNAEVPYRKEMGPVYYSMNIGKIHYIMLDNTEYVNAGGAQGTEGQRNYNRRFDSKQLAWLKLDLQNVDKSTPIIVGTHCPIYTIAYANGAISRALASDADLNNILSCFNGFNSVTFVTGHSHVNRSIQSPTYPNVFEHNVAAVCGTWWWTQRYANNNISTDGSPAGYKIFTVTGTDVKYIYKGTSISDRKQFATYDMNNVKEYWATNTTAQKAFEYLPARANDYSTVGSNVVWINVWAYQPGWTVTATENGSPVTVTQVWNRLDPRHSISYDIPRAATGSSLTFPTEVCVHMFSINTSSANSTLEIKVTDKFGNVYTETMTRPKALLTDPTK